MIWQAGIGLIGQVIGLFGERGKAKQQALTAVAQNFQRTWVDELIVLYWFFPSVLAYLGYTESLDTQIEMLSSSGPLMEIQIGISAAVFGLNKLSGKR